MPSYPGFVGPSYQSSSYMADSERLINRYPEKNESDTAPTPWGLLQCPGFELVVAPTANFGAGMFSESGRTFFVTGFTLYELLANGTTVVRGVVQRDNNPVTFMTNGDAGDQLGLTSGDQFYVMDLTTNVLTTVLTRGATMCGFLDGFGVILDASTSTLQVTAFEDFTSIDPGNIQQRTAGSDPWKSLYVVNRLIYLLGEHTSEVWWDAGTSPFPFAPIQEAFMQQGTAASFSGARLGTSLLWLSHNEQGRGQIVSATGYTPGRVSTHAVETAIDGYGTISDAVAFSYQEHGHTFYLVTFPGVDRSWAFDQATGLFHERLYWDTTAAEWLAYRPLFFCSEQNRNLVQDRLTGAIYRMSTDLFTDVDGAMIRRLRQPPRLSFEQKRFVTNSIQLVMDVGQGTQTGQGRVPQIMRQTSTDGGRTWGNEHWATSGRIGQFDTRVRWTQCGQARNRVDRFIDTDPVPSRFVDCLIDVTQGAS
jgi:hypothetical protein